MIDLGKFVYIKVTTTLDDHMLEAGWPVIDIRYFDDREDVLKDIEHYINKAKNKPKLIEYHNDFWGLKSDQWLLIFPDGESIAYKKLGSISEDFSIGKDT